MPGTDRGPRAPVPKAPPPLPLHHQTRPLPPPGLAGPSPVNYYASPASLSAVSSDTEDVYLRQLEGMEAEANEGDPYASHSAVSDNTEDVYLRQLDEGDSHGDMEANTYEEENGDGREGDMFFELMEEYPDNWPDGCR